MIKAFVGTGVRLRAVVCICGVAMLGPLDAAAARQRTLLAAAASAATPVTNAAPPAATTPTPAATPPPATTPPGAPAPSSPATSPARYTFTWQLGQPDAPAPRGGTTRGPAVTLDTEPSKAWTALQEPGLSPYERDRRAILAMAGDYRVTFDFLEVATFPPQTPRDKPYQSWAPSVSTWMPTPESPSAWFTSEHAHRPGRRLDQRADDHQALGARPGSTSRRTSWSTRDATAGSGAS